MNGVILSVSCERTSPPRDQQQDEPQTDKVRIDTRMTQYRITAAIVARQNDSDSPPSDRPTSLSLVRCSETGGRPTTRPTAIGQERHDPDPEVDLRDDLRHVEHIEGGRRPDPHQSAAADDVGTQPILGQPARRRDDHVAADRRHAAVEHQVLVAGLEKSRRVGDFDLRAEQLAQEHRAHADRRIRLPDRLFRVHERRPAAERRAEKRANLPIRGVRPDAQ